MRADGRDPATVTAVRLSCSVRAEHLYVHVPFCARRCVYCDFSIAVRSRVPVDEYLGALESEWRGRHGESEFELTTVYLGGGTPSKLGPAGVSSLLDIVRSNANVRANAEVTLEVNPEDVFPESVRAWRSAGVNRISLGVQSFHDAALTWMHRTHDAATAKRAIQVLREEGMDNLSIDLIFATPETIGRTWKSDLDAALELGLPHLSVYGLTVEPHTPLGRWVARHDVSEAPEDAFENEYMEAHSRLTAAGFEHYEVSNYGQPGSHSRHNWSYWNRKPYGGLGPSAHEFDGVVRRWNTAPYADWVARTARREDPREGDEKLSKEQSSAEEVYLNLRTTEGLLLSSDELDHVARWVEAGWASVDSESRVILTAAGWLRLDSIASDLTLLRSRY